MLFKTIDIPSEILEAQKNGRLVIFAGAGISMPPPSNLPNFSGLAYQIGEGGSPRSEDETEDRYLGRIHADGTGIPVHLIASQILLNEHSKPTPLHYNILKVF